MRSTLRPIALALVLAVGLPGPIVAQGAGDAAAEPPPRPVDEVEAPEGTTTVTEALQGQEGIRIQTICTHCNSANIQLGGLSQDLAPISRDGYPLFGGLATSFVLGVLPADTVANVEIHKGPGRADAPGPAAGGVIRLTDATPQELPWLDVGFRAGSFGLLGGALRGAGPVTSWLSGSAIVGTETADSVDGNGDGWNDVGEVDREFGEVGVLVTPGRDHTIQLGASKISEDSIDGLGGYDLPLALQLAAPAWTREDTFVDRREFRGGWEWRLPGGGTLDLRAVDAGRDQSVVSQQTRLDIPFLGDFFERLAIREDTRWGSLGYRQPIGNAWLLQGGLEGDDQRVEARTLRVAGDPNPQTGIDYVKTQSAIVAADWIPSPKWDVRFGVRREHMRWGAEDLSEEREDAEWLPRVTLGYRPAAGWTLRLIAGKTARAPKPIFDEVCCGQSYERSFQVDRETGATLAFEGVFQPSATLRVSLYAARTEFDDHIIRVAGATPAYIWTYALANVSEARADTLEIAARWSPRRWIALDGSAGWTSFLNTSGEVVPVQVSVPFPRTVDLPIDRIPNVPIRTGSLAASVDFPREIRARIQTSYTGQMLIQQIPVTGTLRETPSFWLVNVSIEVPVRHDLEIVAGIDNLTSFVQSDLGDRNVDYNWGPLTGRAWRVGLRYHLDRAPAKPAEKGS